MAAPSQLEPRDSSAKLFVDFLSSRGLLLLVSAVSLVVVTRSVPVASFGAYATAVSFATLLAALTDFGASQHLVRSISTRPKAEAIAAYLRARILLTLLTCAGGAVLIRALFPDSATAPALMALGLVLFAGPSMLSPIAQVNGSMAQYRYVVAVQGVTSLTLTAGVVRYTDDATTLVCAAVVGAAAASVVSAWLLRAHLPRLATQWPFQSVIRDLKTIATLGVATLVLSIYYRIDAVIVLRLAGAEEAGFYTGSVRLLDQARLIPSALLIPLAPLIVAQLARTSGVTASFDRLLLRLGMFGGVALGLTCIAAGRLAVAVLMGPRYEPVATLFILLSATLAFSIFAYAATSRAVALRRERGILRIGVAMLLLNVTLNLALVPSFGATGAAVSTLVTELCSGLAMLSLIRDTVARSGYFALAIATCTVSAVAFLDLVLVADSLRIPWTLVVGAAAVFCGLQAVRALRELDTA